MTEREVCITTDAGVHARPAMMLVKEAMRYPCEVFLIKDDMEANGKSIMGVLALAITKGSKITVRAEGGQEEEAVLSIVSLIKSNFNTENLN